METMDTDFKCVFLDRDGVINKPIIIDDKPYSPRNRNEFELFPNIGKYLKKISSLNFFTIIITNQPDIRTKHIDEKLLNEFHNIIRSKMPITDIYVCKHIASDNCYCRKPNPGLILTAAKKYKINLKKSYFIGDRWKDIDAANKAGCYSIFIDYGYKEKLKTNPKNNVKSVKQAFDIILNIEGN